MSDFKKHLWDVVKGALSAAIVAATLAFLNYLGAHIPDVINAAATVAGGVAGVKAKLG